MGRSCDHLNTRLNRATSGHETPAIKRNGKVFVTTALLINRSSYGDKGDLKDAVYLKYLKE